MEKQSKEYQIKHYRQAVVMNKSDICVEYKALDEKFKEEVTIKCYQKDLIKKQNKGNILYRQFLNQPKFHHPNIVQLYDYFEDEDCCYIVFEYCPQSLKQYLQESKEKRLSEVEATHILQQILEGVVELHNNKVIHRYLTLENIFMTYKKQIKIGDFGNSKFVNSNQVLYVQSGSHIFATNFIQFPPEYKENKTYGFFTDIYSCGLIFYALLYGNYPNQQYPESTSSDQQNLILNFSESQTSKDAQDIITKMLEPNLYKRIKYEEIQKHPIFQKFSNNSLYEFECLSNLEIQPQTSSKKKEKQLIQDMNGKILDENTNEFPEYQPNALKKTKSFIQLDKLNQEEEKKLQQKNLKKEVEKQIGVQLEKVQKLKEIFTAISQDISSDTKTYIQKSYSQSNIFFIILTEIRKKIQLQVNELSKVYNNNLLQGEYNLDTQVENFKKKIEIIGKQMEIHIKKEINQNKNIPQPKDFSTEINNFLNFVQKHTTTLQKGDTDHNQKLLNYQLTLLEKIISDDIQVQFGFKLSSIKDFNPIL